MRHGKNSVSRLESSLREAEKIGRTAIGKVGTSRRLTGAKFSSIKVRVERVINLLNIFNKTPDTLFYYE